MARPRCISSIDQTNENFSKNKIKQKHLFEKYLFSSHKFRYFLLLLLLLLRVLFYCLLVFIYRLFLMSALQSNWWFCFVPSKSFDIINTNIIISKVKRQPNSDIRNILDSVLLVVICWWVVHGWRYFQAGYEFAFMKFFSFSKHNILHIVVFWLLLFCDLKWNFLFSYRQPMNQFESVVEGIIKFAFHCEH